MLSTHMTTPVCRFPGSYRGARPHPADPTSIRAAARFAGPDTAVAGRALALPMICPTGCPTWRRIVGRLARTRRTAPIPLPAVHDRGSHYEHGRQQRQDDAEKHQRTVKVCEQEQDGGNRQRPCGTALEKPPIAADSLIGRVIHVLRGYPHAVLLRRELPSSGRLRSIEKVPHGTPSTRPGPRPGRVRSNCTDHQQPRQSTLPFRGNRIRCSECTAPAWTSRELVLADRLPA